MKLKSFFNKFFKKSTPVLSICTIYDLEDIPKREDINNDELIDEYKTIYKSILASNRCLTSFDLIIDTTNEEIQAYTNLLLNICLDDHTNIYKKGEEKSDSINALKLKMYLNDIYQLYHKVECKIVALNELLKERKYFLPPSKKSAMRESLNQLMINRHIFKSHRMAILIEIASYLKNIEIGNISEYDFINKKEHLFLLANTVIPEQLDKILSLNLSPIIELAQIERELEIYVYNHQGEIESLDKKVKELVSSNFVTANIDDIRFSIRDLEIRYEVFGRFGHNFINYEVLKELYALKFQILTFNLCENKKSPINSFSPQYEIEFYEDIVQKKLEAILKGEVNLTCSSKGKHSKIIKLLSQIFKNGHNLYGYKEILENPFLLSLLLSLPNHLVYFLHNYKIKKSNYPKINFYEDICRWEKEIPIISLFKIIELNNNDDNNLLSVFSNNTSLYFLYKIYVFIKDSIEDKKDCYCLPEGINTIDLNNVSLKNQNKKDVESVIIMPSSLKIYKGNLSLTYQQYKIILNSTVEELYFNGITDFFAPVDIVLNPTLKVFEYSCDKIIHAQKLTFQDYKNSEIFNDSDKLVELLKMFFYLQIESRDTTYVLNDQGKIDFTTVQEITFKNTTKITYKIESAVKNIILVDQDGTLITLKPREWNLTFSGSDFEREELNQIKGQIVLEKLISEVQLLTEKIKGAKAKKQIPSKWY